MCSLEDPMSVPDSPLLTLLSTGSSSGRLPSQPFADAAVRPVRLERTQFYLQGETQCGMVPYNYMVL